MGNEKRSGEQREYSPCRASAATRCSAANRPAGGWFAALGRRGPAEQAGRTQPALGIHVAQAQAAAALVHDRDLPRRLVRPAQALATPQPMRLRLAHPHLRPRGHAGFDRQQAGIEHAFARLRQQVLERVQRPHPRLAERVHPQPAQLGDMRAAAQRLAEVAHQAAHVGPGTALHVQPQQWRAAVEQVGGVQQLERMDLDLARLHLDRLAAPRLGVQRLAAALQRGVDRRALLDPAGEPGQRGIDRIHGQRRHRAFAQRLALGVVGIGDDAEPGHGLVGLARAQQPAGDLGGFAEADRQQAGGQGVQAAGMAALLGAEQVAHALQRLVRRQPLRLVQQQDAVQPAEHGARAALPRGRGPIRRRHWRGGRAAGNRCARRDPPIRRNGSAARARGAA